MNTKDITFARNLVKGKIAETIFAQMLRSTGEFTVLEFGYEKIIPELAQQEGGDELVETLRTAPDFAVINKKTREVSLIEVKYRQKFSSGEVLKIAKRMSQSWNPSFLFLASEVGFYFGEVKQLISSRGKILPLVHKQIPSATQEAYLKILNDFEQKT